MDNNVVAQQADFGAASDHALGNHAAGNFADAGDVIDLADFGISQNLFFEFGREQAFQAFLDVVCNIVDDGIVANVNSIAPGGIARLRNGTDVKADNQSIGSFRQGDIRFRNRSDGRVQDLDADLIVGEFFDGSLNGFNRSLNIGFDNNRQMF